MKTESLTMKAKKNIRWQTLFILVTLFFVNASNVWSQGNNSHQSTLISSDARYEIIQSTLAARWTFRLDKHTGVVFQIVQKSDNSLTWEEMLRLPHTLLDTRHPNKVNYQIFMSGTLARVTFLINVNTGATWQLTQDSESNLVFWDPIR